MEEELSTADPLYPNGTAGGGGLVPNGTADGVPTKKQVRRVGAKPPVDRKVTTTRMQQQQPDNIHRHWNLSYDLSYIKLTI